MLRGLGLDSFSSWVKGKWTPLALARHGDPTLLADQSLINFTDPGALGSPQGPSAPRHVYRLLLVVPSYC